MNEDTGNETELHLSPPEPQLAGVEMSRRERLIFLARNAGIACGAIFVLLLLYLVFLIRITPSVEDLRLARAAKPGVLMSSDGRQLGVFQRSQQERIPLGQISSSVVSALIATEDHRFYAHHGIDIFRTLAAGLHTAGGDMQGGSTITQQLARNLFPEEIGRSRTLNRKLKELITALKIEHAYTKDQILESYLNSVPFLYNVVGIEMAARTYYDKPAAELDLLQSATLVGMLKGTSYYNPVINPERAQKRRNVVLGQMVKRGVLGAPEFQALRDKPLDVELTRQPDVLGDAPHFAAHLRQWLIEWADQNDYNLYTDGLVIQTTIDQRLQEAATAAVQRQADALQKIADVEWSRKSLPTLSTATGAYIKNRKAEPFQYFWSDRRDLVAAFIRETPEYKKALSSGGLDAAVLGRLQDDADFIARLKAAKTRMEAGFVAIDPTNGEVRAWVGSRDFTRDQYDHVALAARQPGSTFKPFVYGAALEQGISPTRTYQDVAMEVRAADGSVWKPTDMTGSSGGMLTLREGLIYSKNVITAQVMQDVGLPSIIRLAQALGVNQSKLDPVPSLALGTSPVTLLEMVSAYSTIAQTGAFHKPVFVKSISDRDGKVLATFGTESNRAMSQESAVELIDMMRGVVNQGTGTAVKTRFGIVADIAGKTGTTQNNTDGWFILMHPNLVAGAWVGFNDARVAMRSNYWGQGGHNAILIVGDFFRSALKTKLIDVKARFPRPPQQQPLTTQQAPAEDWLNSPEGSDEESAAPESHSEISQSMDAASGSNAAPGQGRPLNESRTPAELEQIMNGMGRDPVTGEQIQK